MTATRKVARGVAWTVGTYTVSIVTRFGSNIILSRLLTPETFGMVMIVNTVRQGIDLSADVGLAQNVIQNKAGDRPEFFNTAWIMQIVRGAFLCVVLLICAAPIGRLYSVPESAFVLSGAILLVAGLASTSLLLLHRRLQLAKLTMFDLAQDVVSAAIIIMAALVSPTINSLMIAVLIAALIRTGTSYFLTNDRNRFAFNKAHAWEILTFGRWIFLSSILMFLCMSFDRLYIGHVAPLAVVGVYAIARTLADMPILLASRIGYSVVFPVVSEAQGHARADTRARLSAIRFKLLVVAAVGIAFGISVADLAVHLVYDARYHEAGWMLPILLFGVWLAILCSINEYAILGFGKPSYAVIANAIKLVYYLIALPLAYLYLGILGATMVVALSDLGRYAILGVAQKREQFSFLTQDAGATLLFLSIILVMSGIRSLAGFGSAFDTIPLNEIAGLFGRLDGGN
ncbi:oligosaccharide flippase family protein [Hyphomicrobium nitrativorans]|nr:oligosaccharide flippase family protein [Hyphomicrobium nitrativorans]